MSFTRCPDCKRSLLDTVQICPSCGYPLTAVKESETPQGHPIVPRKPLVAWSIVVALLYGLIHLSFLTYISGWAVGRFSFQFAVIMVLCQWSLLRVPIQLEARRPVRRSALWLPIVMSGLFMGLTVFGAALVVSDMSNLPAWPFAPGELPIAAALCTWIAWGFVFWRMSRTASPGSIIAKQSRLLYRGSVLEFLVAVPTHIVARNRGECCAGLPSAFGLWLGLSVAMVAFGPSLFFLYAARWRQVRRLG